MQLSVEIYLKFPLRYDNLRTRPILLRKRKLATIATFIFLIFSVISGYVVTVVLYFMKIISGSRNYWMHLLLLPKHKSNFMPTLA